MAETWNAKKLRHERDIDARLIDETRLLAERVGRLVRTLIPSPSPSRRAREQLDAAIWREVKGYTIGAGEAAFVGARPQSPFARLLADGIVGAVRIQAKRHVAILKRYAPDDVYAWLTAKTRPISEQGREIGYDPFHLFVYGDSPYRLSDRVWITAADVRARIDQVLNHHIPRGTAAVDMADLLVDYLTPGERPVTTRKPYGVEGSYSARRLARTEVTAASGRSFLNAAIANPFVEGVKWTLSPSHPKIDICDDNAAGGPAGDGVYAPESVPTYPAHPHCLCALLPVVVKNPAQVVTQLREGIAAQTPQALRLRGAFELEWLAWALTYGAFVFDVARGE